jgi:hypothetical protein
MKKFVVVLSLLAMGSLCQADTLMTGTLNNGNLTGSTYGYYPGPWTPQGAPPTGWTTFTGTAYGDYTYAAGIVSCGTEGSLANFLGGAQITAGQVGEAYTVQADLGGAVQGNIAPTVALWATTGANGTGTFTLLAYVQHLLISQSGYNLYNYTGAQGTTITAGMVGEYLMVTCGLSTTATSTAANVLDFTDNGLGTGNGGHWIDGFYGNSTAYSPAGTDGIDVTGASVPEPVTMVLLGIGGLALLRKK